MADTRNISSLFSTVLEALRASSPTPQQSDAIVFQSVMMILGNNWAPFDAVRAPLQAYVASMIEGDITREEYTQSLARQLVRCLGDDANVSLELVSVCREDADPLALTEDVCRRHFKVIVDGLLDYEATPEQPFSSALRGAVTAFIGEWFTGLVGMFLYGSQALPGLLQHMAQLVAKTIAEKSPQHAPMATMAAPMAMGLLQRMYGEYLQAQNPAATSA